MVILYNEGPTLQLESLNRCDHVKEYFHSTSKRTLLIIFNTHFSTDDFASNSLNVLSKFNWSFSTLGAIRKKSVYVPR